MGCSGSKSNAVPSRSSGGLTHQEILERIEAPKSVELMVLNGLDFKYSWISQRGYYPESLDKENQDSYTCLPKLENNDIAFSIITSSIVENVGYSSINSSDVIIVFAIYYLFPNPKE